MQSDPHTAQRLCGSGFSNSIDLFAISRISGEMTGSAIGFFFIADSTIKQIARAAQRFLKLLDYWFFRFQASGVLWMFMAGIAFLFPGQGAQFAGMGQSLSLAYDIARRVFEEADDCLGFKVSTLCFGGPEEELQKTENTQPALLTVSVAAYRVLENLGFAPGFVAGHSLGEYSALVAAGALKFADAVRLVQKRGRFMQQAVPPGVGAMAALLKLPEGKLDAILAEAAQGEIVTAANFNSPEQIVIAGNAGAVERAMELAKAAGVKRAVRLAVSAPFHSPLMRPAQQNMAAELNATPFDDLRMPLINNWQAAEIRTADEARCGLYEQIPNPVRWTESIRELANKGVVRFVEVGPGSVLTGLCRGIDSNLKGAKFGESSDLEKVRALLS
jgi:[acyl-carrier-protein] S-malonyltransferase